MIITFDLDDTLYVSPKNIETEKELKFPWNKIYKERIRLGTKGLDIWHLSRNTVLLQILRKPEKLYLRWKIEW